MSLFVEKLAKKFFDRFFWQQHPETALRYLPVVSVIKKEKLVNSKILEVGSGSLGIVPYLKRKIDGLDVSFLGPQTKLLNKIKGSAEKLPFAKNSYEVVLAVDVLEHLPKEKRDQSLEEILRVAEKLAVIVVPVGEEAEKQDRQLAKVWQKTFKEKNQFFEEHLRYGLPKKEELMISVSLALKKLGKTAKIESRRNLNLWARNILMRTWISKNRYIYYLYMKGYLLFLPILRILNFGPTYRQIFTVKIT